MPELLNGFSEWNLLTDTASVLKTQVVYVIRAIDGDRKPIEINRARSKDSDGILNVGSGKGRCRLGKLATSFSSLKTAKDWNRWTHHQLALWCLKYNFSELLGLQKINAENIEYCWIAAPDSKSARAKEKETILIYKSIYADIPIGNLKSW